MIRTQYDRLSGVVAIDVRSDADAAAAAAVVGGVVVGGVAVVAVCGCFSVLVLGNTLTHRCFRSNVTPLQPCPKFRTSFQRCRTPPRTPCSTPTTAVLAVPCSASVASLAMKASPTTRASMMTGDRALSTTSASLRGRVRQLGHVLFIYFCNFLILVPFHSVPSCISVPFLSRGSRNAPSPHVRCDMLFLCGHLAPMCPAR